jgi:2-phospho-L-lactate guanylyltransferase
MSDRESARARIERGAIEAFASRPRDTGVLRTGGRYRPVHDPAPTSRWIVVIPVKGTASAKSRLGGDADDRARIATAIALDTIDVVLATPTVAHVVVVTSVEGAPAVDETDAFVVVEPEPAGLGAALELGLQTAAEFGAPGLGTAVLLGDLPALRPEDLADALERAASFPRAMVADAAGTGTTLVTAADGQAHDLAFGADSASAHRSRGYAELPVDAHSGVRHDVDTADDLAALAGRLGPRTTVALEGRHDIPSSRELLS